MTIVESRAGINMTSEHAITRWITEHMADKVWDMVGRKT